MRNQESKNRRGRIDGRSGSKGSAWHSSPARIYSYGGKRPSLRPAGTKGCGYHESLAVQPATRAAAQIGGDLIRKMRPFEEPHAFADHRGHVEKICITQSK
jgi:hypothetical protein